MMKNQIHTLANKIYTEMKNDGSSLDDSIQESIKNDPSNVHVSHTLHSQESSDEFLIEEPVSQEEFLKASVLSSLKKEFVILYETKLDENMEKLKIEEKQHEIMDLMKESICKAHEKHVHYKVEHKRMIWDTV